MLQCRQLRPRAHRREGVGADLSAVEIFDLLDRQTIGPQRAGGGSSGLEVLPGLEIYAQCTASLCHSTTVI